MPGKSTISRTKQMAPLNLTSSEREWLEAVAQAEGLTMADTVRRLIREAAERRGIKEKVSA